MMLSTSLRNVGRRVVTQSARRGAATLVNSSNSQNATKLALASAVAAAGLCAVAAQDVSTTVVTENVSAERLELNSGFLFFFVDYLEQNF